MKSHSRIVIVAEDELLTRMTAADALISAGFTVIEADHAEAALMVLQSRAIEVCALFTDVNMPGPMDGLGLAHHAATTWPWVRLLVASGKAQPRADDLPSGCRFLAKPYDPDHMVRHILALTTAI